MSSDLDRFRDEAARWLAAHADPRPDRGDELQWGIGSDNVAIFHNLTEDEERQLAELASRWQRAKFDAGYGAITWPAAFGGRGLSAAHERAFRELESRFVTPTFTELFGVTIGLIAPTILWHGTEVQQERFIKPLLRTDLLACQLFSEPAAGSDLASVACRAERDGDGWVLNGQKVWTSGARVAHYGEAICRTDIDAEKHTGLTAFLVPLDAEGVEVRPIRQMTGGASFNEVFLTDVRISDELRLGAEGDGWSVALTTLGFERGASSAGAGEAGGGFGRVLALARHLGVTDDPLVRHDLVSLYMGGRVLQLTGLRVQQALRAGQAPGPEGSVGKLMWTRNLTMTSEVAARILGPRITADSGEWGTFAWTEHLLGAPGYRIAGGSDEIQHNIIGERVLGLPREPRPLVPGATASPSVVEPAQQTLAAAAVSR
jgi:alkylation response protein AidB-like acyl-CoA dehydrogenase